MLLSNELTKNLTGNFSSYFVSDSGFQDIVGKEFVKD